MPKALEDRLAKEAAAKGLKGARAKAYIYGTMQEKTSWKPGKRRPMNGPLPKDNGGDQDGE